MAKGKLIAIWQLGLVYTVHESAGLPIGRNHENSGHGQMNACQAVADAFTRAGRKTTYEQIRSIVYDAGYQDLREVAKAIGSLDKLPLERE